MNAQLLLGEEVYAIVGAAMAVYNELGIGFLEAVYQEALECELAERNIPFEAQQALTVSYKGKPLRKMYCADLVCYGQIIVELKTSPTLGHAETAPLLNYLKASALPVGVLLNFGAKEKIEWKRTIL